MSACILCGCSGHTNSAVSDSSFSLAAAGYTQSKRGVCTPCLLLKEIDSKITEITSSLVDKRNDLQSGMNYARDPFHHLPYELASKICMLSTGSDANYQKISLGAVNQQWRAIVWSIPQLWTFIPIYLTPPDFRHQLSMVKTHLALSGSRPLSISVGPKACRPLTKARKKQLYLLDPVWAAIGAHSERWQVINMEIPLCIFPRLQRIGRRSSKLQHFKIDIIGSEGINSNPTLNMWKVHPSPVAINVSQLSLNSVGINWCNAIQVNVDYFTEAECLELFQRAPKMRTCSIGLRNDDAGHNISGELIAHPCLQSLEVVKRGLDELAILHNLALPSLDSISLSGDSFLLEWLYRLLFYPSCHISSLILESQDTGDIFPVLLLAHSIEKLELGLFTFEDDDPLVKLLAETLAIPDDAELRQAFLPNLASLICYPTENVQHLWPSIPTFFPPRQKAPNTRYRPFRKLELHIVVKNINDDDYIDKHSLPPLLDLVERGFDLRIINKGFYGEMDLIHFSHLHHQNVEKELEAMIVDE